MSYLQIPGADRYDPNEEANRDARADMEATPPEAPCADCGAETAGDPVYICAIASDGEVSYFCGDCIRRQAGYPIG